MFLLSEAALTQEASSWRGDSKVWPGGSLFNSACCEFLHEYLKATQQPSVQPFKFFKALTQARCYIKLGRAEWLMVKSLGLHLVSLKGKCGRR